MANGPSGSRRFPQRAFHVWTADPLHGLQGLPRGRFRRSIDPVDRSTYIENENSVALYISTRTASVSDRRAMFEFPFQVTILSRWSPVRTSQSPKLNPLRGRNLRIGHRPDEADQLDSEPSTDFRLKLSRSSRRGSFGSASGGKRSFWAASIASGQFSPRRSRS